MNLIRKALRYIYILTHWNAGWAYGRFGKGRVGVLGDHGYSRRAGAGDLVSKLETIGIKL